MENHTDFYAFYNRVLRPEIARIEPLRQQTVFNLCAITIATVIGTVIWAGVISRLFGLKPLDRVVFYSCLIPIGVGMAIWTPIWKKYRDDYQLKLIVAIVRLYNAAFTYDRDAKVGGMAFTDSGLFRRYENREGLHYRGTDWVSGKIGATSFEFSDLDVSVSSGKSRQEIFRGVFFVADFNKNFSGETYVTSRHSLLHLSLVPDTPPGDVVKLEDPEFESAFATHSNSQIEARYILTPALMRRILHFSQQRKTPVAIAFRGTSMFIAMYNASTKLEPVLWQTLHQPSLFFGIWANLEFLCGIVSEMDLNTRIWTKVAEPAPIPGLGIANASSP
jgi:hypothetical protein